MEDNNLESIYRCPACKLRLLKKDRQYICNNGHNYDISGNGYVNLLLGNQKKTKEPGDNKEMMESRRGFLNRGYYSKFSDELNRIAGHYLDRRSRFILDAGCGEGYFLTRFKRFMDENGLNHVIDYYGIDISKSAVKYASKRDSSIHFAVGSNFNLPLLDDSLDLIIRNFAPSDNNEFCRVIRKGGMLIIVTPGSEHLYELKELLYPKARKHDIKDTALEGFKHQDFIEFGYRLSLDNNEDIKNLISMTPYYWSITDEMRSNLNNICSLNTALHFNFNVYTRV